MNTKDYLIQYSELCEKIQNYQERIEQIEASLTKSIQLDGLPHGTGTSDPTQSTAIKLADISTRLNAARMEAELTRQTIASELEKVENPLYRELLYLRYLKNGIEEKRHLMKWEDVTDELSKGRDNRYDCKHVMSYMHGKALKAFEKARNRSTSNIFLDNPQG